MRLLKVITTLCSWLLLFGNVAAQGTKEIPTPVFLGEDIKYSMPHFLWKTSQYMSFKLKKSEKQQHQSAVYYMLNNVPNGQIVSWYSDQRLASGKVRVIHSYPISGGYCRQYQAFIQVKNKSKHTTNNACRYDTQTWFFYK